MSDLIKEIREMTGAGILDVKKALDESGQDKEKAIEWLRKKGSSKVGAKSERSAKEGIIETYIHAGGRVGVLIELNCETDFVGRTDSFKQLAKDLALHVAAASPLYVAIENVPAEVVEKEKEIYKEQAAGAGKTGDVVEKMLEGKINKFYEEACLMEQPYVKNPDQRIKDIIGQATLTLGENIKIGRFARFILGS